MEKAIETTIYTVDMRKDQWDLIVLSLSHVREMTTVGNSAYAVDTIGRRFFRRCIDETVGDIQAQVPK